MLYLVHELLEYLQTLLLRSAVGTEPEQYLGVQFRTTHPFSQALRHSAGKDIQGVHKVSLLLQLFSRFRGNVLVSRSKVRGFKPG